MSKPGIYVDFGHGVSHGISSANNLHLTPEAMATLKEYIDGTGKLAYESNPELAEIVQLHLSNHPHEIESPEDFEYGFWVGLYSSRKRMAAAAE